MTPSPSGPSSLASALAPTKEMLTKVGLKRAAMRELDELGAGPVGPDHDDRFGLGALDGAPGRADRAGVALEGAFGGELEAALVQRALDAGEAVAAEGIVLVEDGDAGEVRSSVRCLIQASASAP